jgi:hypothetical protein
MKHPWTRRAPLLLMGLADLALGGYLLWSGGRAMLRVEGPSEVTLSGFVVLAGLLTCAMGLPALVCFLSARQFAPRMLRWCMAAALIIGGLPWVGVACFFWPAG